MSGMWNKTLIYLGLREEADEVYDDMPARFDPEDDPHAEHAPARPATDGIPPDQPTEAIERAPALARSAAVADDRDSGSSGSSSGSDRRGARASSRESASHRAEGDAEPSRLEAGHTSNVRSLYGGEEVRARSAVAPLTRTAVIDVHTFDDVESVGARYRTGQPVLFDVSTTDKVTARRVVDFISGMTFALRGSLSKVGTGAFLLVPDGLELPADERRRLGDLGYRVSMASYG